MDIKDIGVETLRNHSVLLDKMEENINIIDMTSVYWDEDIDNLYNIIQDCIFKLKGIVNNNLKKKEQALLKQEEIKERKPRKRKNSIN